MTSTTTWIPDTLKIPPSHAYHDQLLMLVNHLLVRRNARPKEHRNRPLKLDRSLLKALAGGAGGGHGATVRDELEQMGFLVVDHDYAPTRRCKHVTLSPLHCNAELVEVPFNRKPRARAVLSAKGKPTAIEKYLLDNLCRTSASHIALEDVIGEDFSSHKLDCYRLQLNQQHLGLHYGSRRSKGRRFYSDFTCLAKPIRRRIKIDGQQLVEVDVSCCQPCLLHHVLSEHYNSNKKILLNLSSQELFENLSKYKTCVERGDFYQHWADLEDCFKTQAVKGSPSNAKREFCRMVFGFYPYCMNYDFGRRFKEIFPAAWEILDHLKQREQLAHSLPKKDRHKQLAWKLQEMESTCMLDDVVGGIINEGLSLPILTVHDAILTTPPYVDQIKRRIKRSFLQRYGVRVGVGVKGGESPLAA